MQLKRAAFTPPHKNLNSDCNIHLKKGSGFTALVSIVVMEIAFTGILIVAFPVNTVTFHFGVNSQKQPSLKEREEAAIQYLISKDLLEDVSPSYKVSSDKNNLFKYSKKK